MSSEHPNTVVTLIRHGETDWNKTGRWQGHTDVQLNETGRMQAKQTHAFLFPQSEESPFDVLITSDLSRAVETAKIVIGTKVIPTETDVRLREITFGDWEGLTTAEIDGKMTVGAKESFLKDRLTVTPPNGESVTELFARVKNFQMDMLERHRGKSILIVSHGGTLRAFLSLIMGNPPDSWLRMELGNCAVSRVIWREVWREEGHPRIQLLGYCCS